MIILLIWLTVKQYYVTFLFLFSSPLKKMTLKLLKGYLIKNSYVCNFVFFLSFTFVFAEFLTLLLRVATNYYDICHLFLLEHRFVLYDTGCAIVALFDRHSASEKTRLAIVRNVDLFAEMQYGFYYLHLISSGYG